MAKPNTFWIVHRSEAGVVRYFARDMWVSTASLAHPRTHVEALRVCNYYGWTLGREISIEPTKKLEEVSNGQSE